MPTSARAILHHTDQFYVLFCTRLYLVGMIADQNCYDICFTVFFYPTASATAYSQRLKFVRAEHSATAEDENCAYGLTPQRPRTDLNKRSLPRPKTTTA